MRGTRAAKGRPYEMPPTFGVGADLCVRPFSRKK